MSSMLAEQRRRQILAMLDQQKGVRVRTLAHRFEVTEETIRRDLDALEADGKLKRSHGGAVPLDAEGRELPHWARERVLMAEKRALARAAVERVREGDTLVLDPSSTVLHVAQQLPDIPLTVITNSLQVGLALAERRHIRLILSGGALSHPSLSLVGPKADETLRSYHADRVFMSCRGLDAEWGVSDPNEQQVIIRQAMLAISDHAYLLLDHSKIGRRALARIAGVEAFDEIFVDDAASESDCDFMARHAVRLNRVSVPVTRAKD